MTIGSGLTLRLLVDRPRDGAWNMAADELLLEEAGREATAVLRLYAWARPTLSLGRSQPYRQAVDEAFCRMHGINIVRRPTGGWALLHDREVTYALAAPASEGPFAGGLLESYRKIGEVLSRSLRRLGATVAMASGEARRPGGPLCFSAASAFEIVAASGDRSGAKLVGSSQRRRRGTFLQHGSVPLELDPGLEAAATGAPARSAGVSLSALCGRTIGFDEAAGAVVEAFASHPGISVVPWRWSESDRERIEGLRAGRYLSARWTRGAPGKRGASEET